MAADADFAEVESHFSRRIYFILWLAELAAFIIAVYLPDFRQGDITRAGRGFRFIWSVSAVALVAFVAWKSVTPAGRRWLSERPPSSLNTTAPGRVMRLAIWGVPLLAIVGIVISRLYFG